MWDNMPLRSSEIMMTDILILSDVRISWIQIIAFSLILLTCIYAFISWLRIKKYHRPTVVQSCEQDVIVIGAGVVGSAMAVTIARQGRKVKIIERDMNEPDRIVGELMQPGGCIALQQLGLLEATDGIDAHNIKGYVIHENIHNTQVVIPYPEELGEHEGRAFHHGRFIMGLRKAVLQEKNITVVEGSASKLIEEQGVVVGCTVKIKDTDRTESLYAPLTVVADGCFSRFRKDTAILKPETKSHFVGMIMKNCPQAKPNHAELVMTETSPVLVYQISSTSTRVLVDVRGGLPRDLKGYLRDEVAPDMPEHLAEPFIEALNSDRIRSMPNSFLPAKPIEKPGVIAIGDAYNMRHPLTGGGMSVALNDVVIWRRLLHNIPDLTNYASVMKAQRSFNWQRKNAHAFVINVLSFALYELFAANDRHLFQLKEACFEYFKLGGQCVTGPVGLLSVLRPRPHILIGHFFAVAFYAIWLCFCRAGWRLHRAVTQSTGVLYKACQVIFPLIWSEVRTFL